MNPYSTFKNRLFSGLIDGLIFLPFILGDYYLDLSNKYVFIGYNIMYILSYLIYSVYFHGKYGQTIGKRVMKVRVLDMSENNVIGYKRAFLRDSVWLLIYLIASIDLVMISDDLIILTEQHRNEYDIRFLKMWGIWLLFELISFWATSKRRTIHDFIADSVVVKLEKSVSPAKRLL